MKEGDILCLSPSSDEVRLFANSVLETFQLCDSPVIYKGFTPIWHHNCSFCATTKSSVCACACVCACVVTAGVEHWPARTRQSVCCCERSVCRWCFSASLPGRSPASHTASPEGNGEWSRKKLKMLKKYLHKIHIQGSGQFSVHQCTLHLTWTTCLRPYLQLFSIKVLQVLLWKDLVEAFKKSLCLLLHPPGQPPLCDQPAGATHIILILARGQLRAVTDPARDRDASETCHSADGVNTLTDCSRLFWHIILVDIVKYVKLNVTVWNSPDVLFLVFLCDLDVSSSWFQVVSGDFPQNVFVNREEHFQPTFLDVVVPEEKQWQLCLSQTHRLTLPARTQLCCPVH